MKNTIALSLLVILTSAVNGQTIQGSKVRIECEPSNSPGATIAVTPIGNGQAQGTYSFVSLGNNQTQFRADLSQIRPQSSRLELLSGTNVVRSIPGPHSTSDVDFATIVLHTTILRPDEEWVPLALAAAAFLISCVDYTGSTTTTTTGPNGELITIAETSGQWSWDCGILGATVNVDGVNYPNITGIRVVSTIPQSMPSISSLQVSATGGARIRSAR